MIYKTIVMNSVHPEYGEAMIPLPIPQEQYEDSMEMLDRMEIIGAEKALCQIQETDESIVTGMELSRMDFQKLNAAIAMVSPQTPQQLKNLAGNLDLFYLLPMVHTAEEYGKYMIQESSNFAYDENLDDFYAYEKLGQRYVEREQGIFTSSGYIAYKGETSLEEVLNGHSEKEENPLESITRLLGHNCSSPKLKALIEYFKVQNLETAAELSRNLDDYILLSEVHSAQDMAAEQIRSMVGECAAEQLMSYLDLEGYGTELIRENNAVMTSEGLLQREDGTVMKLPPRQNQLDIDERIFL